ncbi:Amidohydrolase [Pleurostoma richardsiae]|uniref:Amidohydrolase n=1 Tax=Pleurostoma richardsiae TaxID=41990 RepID=A0AA38RD00_9PEZI|nr:Amidohydrolase [Pleurostoma richardsiae]
MKLHHILSCLAVSCEVSSACSNHYQPAIDDATYLVRRTTPGRAVHRMVLTNVRVFDGYKVGLPQSVYIEGEHISRPFPHCFATETVDAGGRILIPGLMDSHIHVPDVAGLENLTAHGVTTAFNMACYNYTQCHTLSNFPNTPEGAGLATLYSSGIAANSPLTPNNFNGGYSLTAASYLSEDGDPAAYIDWAFNNGSDYYKIVVKQPGLSQRLQDGLVAEAHRLGKLTMTHASQLESYLMAVQSDTDGIQHIPSDGALPADVVARIVAHRGQQWVTPTMEIFKQAFAQPIIMLLLRGSTETNDTYAYVRNNVASLHRAGVNILAGTDAVGTVTTAVVNLTLSIGYTLHSELENLVGAGLSEAEALRAATVVPAKMYGLDDRGSIEVGKRADLVLLDADPLANITNTRKISGVWVGGIEYLDVVSS